MIRQQLKPPATQRSFASAWRELDYLCAKVRYWLYTRKQKSRAARYLDRLEGLLHDVPANGVAILRHEALALLYELKGELGKSIAHRRQEIELMERLHEDAQSEDYAASTKAYMLRDRDGAALRDRRQILEALQKARADAAKHN